MAIGIYKKGQGYWTRLMSAIALGTLVLMGVVWLWNLLQPVQIGDIQTIYVQAAATVVVLAVFAWLGFYLLAVKPRVVDFMIATEGEMKKVHWSSRREILGSTWVVIALTFFIAVFCFGVDQFFAWVFTLIKVLDTAAA
jgi:preprotein translocase subunit SecE